MKGKTLAGKEEARAESIIVEIVERLGYIYLGLEFLRYKEQPNELVIYIDRLEGGVDLDDCELVSRALDQPLDSGDPVSEPYILCISSPGIDRALKTDRELDWGIGKKVDLKTFAKINGTKEFCGLLLSHDSNCVQILISDDNKMDFPKNKIAVIRLHIDF